MQRQFGKLKNPQDAKQPMHEVRCQCLSTEIAAISAYEYGNKPSNPPKRKCLDKLYSYCVLIAGKCQLR